jgi:hypothetical protein
MAGYSLGARWGGARARERKSNPTTYLLEVVVMGWQREKRRPLGLSSVLLTLRLGRSEP